MSNGPWLCFVQVSSEYNFTSCYRKPLKPTYFCARSLSNAQHDKEETRYNQGKWTLFHPIPLLIKSSRLRIKTKRLLVTHKSNQASTVPLRMRCSLCLEMIRGRGVQAAVVSTWSSITTFYIDSNRNLSLEAKTLAQHLRRFSKPQIVWRSVAVHSIAL